MKKAVCRCRSYCTRYDPSTDAYVGPGLSIPFKTARRHALEDQQAEALGNFVGSPGPPVSEPVSPADAGTPDVEEPSQEELSTLKAEIAGRTAWATTDRPLVFFTDPGPSQKFTFPKPTELHLSNYGPHALDPTHHHWGQGYLETGKNMSGTLKGQELFTWHVSVRHISCTFGM